MVAFVDVAMVGSMFLVIGSLPYHNADEKPFQFFMGPGGYPVLVKKKYAPGGFRSRDLSIISRDNRLPFRLRYIKVGVEGVGDDV